MPCNSFNANYIGSRLNDFNLVNVHDKVKVNLKRKEPQVVVNLTSKVAYLDLFVKA